MSQSQIIKRPQNGKKPNSSAVVKRVLIDASADALELIERAETHARVLRVASEEDARLAREQAFKEGMEASLLQLNSDLIAARELRHNALSDVEVDVLRLSVKIAERIIGREIDRDDATVADIVATAMRQARQSEMVTVRISPGDATKIKKYRSRLEPGGRVRFIDFVPDPTVKRGGCLIVTDTGTIDAQLETQLRVLEKALVARARGEDS